MASSTEKNPEKVADVAFSIKRLLSTSPDKPDPKVHKVSELIVSGSDFDDEDLDFTETEIDQNINFAIVEKLFMRLMKKSNATLGKTIEIAVAAAVGPLTHRVEILEEENRNLRETVEKLTLDGDQSTLYDEVVKRIVVLEEENCHLRNESEQLRIGLNDLEQYGRRNSVRITGVKVPDPNNVGKEFVSGFLNDKIQANITPGHIERCHPIGRKDGNGNSQFIVKFKTYDTRSTVMKKRTNAEAAERLYINEDLTRTNYGIVRHLRAMKRDGVLFKVWTYDGRIYAKKRENGPKFQVRRMSECAHI